MTRFCNKEQYNTINDVWDAYPGATGIVEVIDGWMVFDTWTDYGTWINQT